MIQRKKKVCKTCETEQYLFSQGNCKFCASKTKKKVTYKGRSKAKIEKSKVLVPFFVEAISKAEDNPYCEETGEYISEPSSWNIAHIIPKSSNPEIMTHPLNYMVYSKESHAMFDHLLFSHKLEELEKTFPNSWPIVLDKLKVLMPLITKKNNLFWKLEEYLLGL